MKDIILYIVFSLLICSKAYSQEKIDQADRYFADFKFHKAIELYQGLVEGNKKPSVHLMQHLADSYFNIGHYKEAKDWYLKLFQMQGKDIGEGNLIKLVQSLKASLEHKKANEILYAYYTQKERRGMIMAQKEYLDSISNEKERYRIRELWFNSQKSDFAPFIYNKNVVFTSARDTVEPKGKIYPWNKQPYLDLYIASPFDRELAPIKFMPDIESSYHDGTAVFSKDGKTVYFTRNYLKDNKRLSANSEGVSHMQIMKGTISGNRLINVEALSFNDKEYSCGHPALAPNGRYLYFTSNMPGGYGETDLYGVELNSDGTTVGSPANLGSRINTRGREMFPFVTEGILYFSSDGHYGLGGLDIFSSAISSRSDFTMPQNLGKPINSNMDDFSYVLTEDKDRGYFASNRSGGTGDDDIYQFENIEPIDCLVYSGYVLNKNNREPIVGATVELNKSIDGSMEIVNTDESGFFRLVLPCNQKNTLFFQKKGHSKEALTVITGKTAGPASTNNIILLTPFESLVEKEGEIEKIKVDPIYFEYDRSDITTRAELELDKVLFAMNEFPEIKIKIESHTDSRGSDQYNLRLSDERAKSTERYLLSKGIDPSRIESARGYGEYRLKNKCQNGVHCNKQEHLENRRSDFIIVSK